MVGPKLSFVIPAFNERERLPRSLEILLSFFPAQRYHAEFIVVDDGSTDATADLVRSYAERDHRVMLIRNLENRGKGFSVRRGALAASGDIVLLVDADLCLPVGELLRLIKTIKAGADIAIGSRRKLPSQQVDAEVPIIRRFTSFGMHLCTRLILGLPYADTQCGFKAFRRAAAHALFPLLTINGWGFDSELLVLARELRFHTVEVGLKVGHDARGSKVRVFRDSVHVLGDVAKIWARANSGAYLRSLPSPVLAEPTPGRPPAEVA